MAQINTVSDTLLSNDMRIEFRIIKEKRCTRTFVYNLEHFIEAERLAVIIKDIKKALGTSCAQRETDFGKGYGFSGEFIDRIREILCTKYGIDKSCFK